ncbi:actin binding protein [Dispira simplex]|nr:actin binding protein [Dispira simplex]
MSAIKVNFATHSQALVSTHKRILEGDPSITWAVYTYDKGTNDLKVQEESDEGLEELAEAFDDGKIQYAFARVQDSNTKLAKFVFISWCGSGVPVSKKGLFGSHLSDVSRYFRGYHVQIDARDEDNVSPEHILKRVSESSGSRYSFHTDAPAPAPVSAPSPPVRQSPAAPSPPRPSFPRSPVVISPSVPQHHPEPSVPHSYTPNAAQLERQKELENLRNRRNTKSPEVDWEAEDRANRLKEEAERQRRQEMEREREEQAERERMAREERLRQQREEEAERERLEQQRREDELRRQREEEAAAVAARERQRQQEKAEEERQRQDKLEREARERAQREAEEARKREEQEERERAQREAEERERHRQQQEKEAEEVRHREAEQQKAQEEEAVRKRKEVEEEALARQFEQATARSENPADASQTQGLTAKALYSYDAGEDNELTFTEDDLIIHIEKLADEWWFGFSEDGQRSGLFPSNFVELVETPQLSDQSSAPPPPPPAPPLPDTLTNSATEDLGEQAVALFDFTPSEDNELGFMEGEIIHHIEFLSDEWWQGSNAAGHVGLFPANYVELKK